MDIKDLDDNPDWDFYRFSYDGDEWKIRPKREAAKALYEQARQIYVASKVFCASLNDKNTRITKALIMENALLICPKIVAAEEGDLYSVRMENASIIRTNCRLLMDQVRFADYSDRCNTQYRQVLETEMDKFRELFVTWVDLFEKDDFEDEWGLYK